MAFPRRLLNDEEDIALDLRPHWWFLSGPAALVTVLVVVGVVGLAQDWPGPIKWVVALVLVGGLAWLGVRYARWASTNFVVTTDRLIFRSGVIAKHGIEIPLERVNNVIFNQTIFERILGAGDLLIESAGQSGQQRFADITHPSGVQNEIYRQIEANETRTAERVASAHRSAVPRRDGDATSIPEQIRELSELRDQGIISAEEFETKKRDLLDRM
ncbi:MAG TPA: PH domain-containing protein [Acidimicrobiales bacterium]